MTIHDLSDNSLKLEQQLIEKEKIDECLSKAEALLQVAYLASAEKLQEFTDLRGPVIHDYFWALGDIIAEAKKLNEVSRAVMLKEYQRLGMSQ